MKQTLIAFMEDAPGVLNRIANLLRRRNYNIESIVAGHTQIPNITRMTIVTDESCHHRRANIPHNLKKLVNVYDVKDITGLPSVVREYILVKVAVVNGDMKALEALVKSYGAKIIDKGKRSIIIEASGKEQEIKELIEKLQAFKILELMRSGKMAMIRGFYANQQPNLNKNSVGEPWATSRLQNALF